MLKPPGNQWVVIYISSICLESLSSSKRLPSMGPRCARSMIGRVAKLRSWRSEVIAVEPVDCIGDENRVPLGKLIGMPLCLIFRRPTWIWYWKNRYRYIVVSPAIRKPDDKFVWTQTYDFSCWPVLSAASARIRTAVRESFPKQPSDPMDDFESFPSAVYFWVYHGKMTVGWFYFTPFSVYTPIWLFGWCKMTFRWLVNAMVYYWIYHIMCFERGLYPEVVRVLQLLENLAVWMLEFQCQFSAKFETDFTLEPLRNCLNKIERKCDNYINTYIYINI
jgi:hypothetical protein